MGKIMYKGQEFRGKIERQSDIKPDKDKYLVYKWDFTKSLVDEINGIELGNVRGTFTPSENGIYFENASDSFTIDISENNGDYYFGKTIEMEFGEFSAVSDHREILDLRKKSVFRNSGTGTSLIYLASGYEGKAYTTSHPDTYSTQNPDMLWRWPSEYDTVDKRKTMLSNKTVSLYQDDSGSTAIALDDFLMYYKNCNVDGYYGTCPVLNVNMSYDGGTGSNYYLNTKRYFICNDAYLCIGDVRSSVRKGLVGCYLKGIRMYDGMFVNLSRLIEFDTSSES